MSENLYNSIFLFIFLCIIGVSIPLFLIHFINRKPYERNYGDYEPEREDDETEEKDEEE